MSLIYEFNIAPNGSDDTAAIQLIASMFILIADYGF
jgi:hypothetical protein